MINDLDSSIVDEAYQHALAKQCCSILSNIEPNFDQNYNSYDEAELNIALMLNTPEGTKELYDYLSSKSKENIATTSRHMSAEDRKNWNNELLIRYDNLLKNLEHYCNSFEPTEEKYEKSFVR